MYTPMCGVSCIRISTGQLGGSLQLWNATSARINLEPSCVPVCFFVLKFLSVSMFRLLCSTSSSRPRVSCAPREGFPVCLFRKEAAGAAREFPWFSSATAAYCSERHCLVHRPLCGFSDVPVPLLGRGGLRHSPGRAVLSRHRRLVEYRGILEVQFSDGIFSVD